jgi:aminopeptidase N
VEIEVREPTDRLVLNARDMSFASATVDGVGPASKIAFDDGEQTVTLTFRRPLGVGRQVLRIAFAAQIHKNGRGMYYADYETADGRKRMLATHSEPTDARRIFPGWDEPVFKATFSLSVAVPAAFRAVSNMPVVREQADGTARKIEDLPDHPVRGKSEVIAVRADHLESQGLRMGGVFPIRGLP